MQGPGFMLQQMPGMQGPPTPGQGPPNRGPPPNMGGNLFLSSVIDVNNNL